MEENGEEALVYTVLRRPCCHRGVESGRESEKGDEGDLDTRE
jgi:hypothetical protein